MEGGSVLFDASSYMLFEASGDSEGEYFDTAVGAELVAAAAEDDAQSCSCGWLYEAGHEIDASGDNFHGSDFDDCIEEEEDDSGGCSTEVEDGVVDQCCRGGKTTAAVAVAVAVAEELNKPKACENSDMKLTNEGERDRLFWEACLAS